MILLKLFLSFLKIGAFAVGGAYSFLPLIEKEVVEKYHWLSKEEFLDILGVTQVFPGAISIKYATYTGYKVAGIPGALLANLANVLVPAVVIIFISIFYTRYKELKVVKSTFEAVRLAIFAMIIAVAFQTIDIRGLIQIKSILIIVFSFILFFYAKVHPALVIILIGLLGALCR